MILTSPGDVAGGLQRGDGAERHLVVVGVDRRDVGIVGDQLLGDGLAHRPLVVRRLLGDDLDVRVELLEALQEAVVAVRRDVHAGRTEQDGEAALTTGLPDHRVGGSAALLDEVRADPADVVLARCLRGEQPVDRHDRHAVLLGVVERRVEAFAVQRGDDQCVDALVDHALDVGDLLVEVGLGVGDDQVDPACLGFVADRLRLGDAERVRFPLGLGEADRGAGQVDLLDAVAGVVSYVQMSPDVPATCWPAPASVPSVAVPSGSVPAGSVAAGSVAAGSEAAAVPAASVAAGALVPSPPESALSSSPHAAAAITRPATSASRMVRGVVMVPPNHPLRRISISYDN